MSKRGRKPKLDPPCDWKVRIPSSLRERVEAQLPRKPNSKIPLSAKGDLTAMLLLTWVEEQEGQEPVDLTQYLGSPLDP